MPVADAVWRLLAESRERGAAPCEVWLDSLRYRALWDEVQRAVAPFVGRATLAHVEQPQAFDFAGVQVREDSRVRSR